MKQLLQESLNKAIDYKSYRELIKTLLAEGKSTGHTQSESLLNYSNLNDRRMKRLDKTIDLSDETLNTLDKLQNKYTLLTISEGWCGDAAQSLPILNKMSNAAENLEFKIVLRDENEALMDLFLTNGSKSIPKVIVLDEALNVFATWGARPSVASEIVQNHKKKYGVLDAEFKKDLQVWYNKDKGKTVQEDFVKIFTTTKQS